MIVLATNKSIMRSKLLIVLFWVSISWSKCRPPDQYYWTNSISWTNWISISWSKIRPPEKVEFWSHEIRPHDHFPNVTHKHDAEKTDVLFAKLHSWIIYKETDAFWIFVQLVKTGKVHKLSIELKLQKKKNYNTAASYNQIA